MTTTSLTSSSGTLDTWIVRLFALISVIEAITWAGLLAGMYLKYVAGTTDAWVSLFGALHGVAFIAYVAFTILAAWRLRWTWKVTLAALLAAVPPLATIPMELWLLRRGALTPRQSTVHSTVA